MGNRDIGNIKKNYVGKKKEVVVTYGNQVGTVDVDTINNVMNDHHNEGIAFKHVEPNDIYKRHDLPSYAYSDDVRVTILTDSLIINGMVYNPKDLKSGITINKTYYSLEDIYKKFATKELTYRLQTKNENFLHDLNMKNLDHDLNQSLNRMTPEDMVRFIRSSEDSRTAENKVGDHFKSLKQNEEIKSKKKSLNLLNDRRSVNNPNEVNRGIDVESSCILDIEDHLHNLDSLIKEFVKPDTGLKFSRVSRYPISDKKISTSYEPFYPYLSVEWVIYNLNKLHMDNSGFSNLFKKNSLLEDSEDLTVQTYGDASVEESLFRLLFNIPYNQDSSLNYFKDVTIITKVNNEIRSVTSRFYLLPTFETRLDSNGRPYVHIETHTETRNGNRVTSTLGTRYNNITLSNRPSYIDSISISGSDKVLEDNMIAFIMNDIRIKNIINTFMIIADTFVEMFRLHRTKILYFDFERGNIIVDIKQDIHNFRYDEACDRKEIEDDYGS